MAVSAGPSVETRVRVEASGADPVSLLARASGLSRGRIKDAMTKGAVWLEAAGAKPRRLRRASHRLETGDRLALYYNERILAQTPEPVALIADEKDYSVWYKPRGLFSQGSRWGDHCAIARVVELRLQRAAYLVHRLDLSATGLILVAHNRRAAGALSRLFRERKIDKRYQAIVRGRFPDSAIFDTPLDGKPARTTARRLDARGERSLLEIRIETGRKHQIRRHLAAAGYPVIGDRLHGNDQDADLQLCATVLAFTCPLAGVERCYHLPDKYRPDLMAHS